MYTLFDFLPSGNGYKVRLILRYLDIPFDYIEVDITSGGTRTRDFLSKNRQWQDTDTGICSW